MHSRKHTTTRQHTATRMRTIHLISCFLLLLLPIHLQAAGGDTIKVSLRANAQQDRIQLRWAVNSPSAWYFTNKNGFTLVRYTIMRDSTVLETPEKITIAHVLKPQPLDEPFTAKTFKYRAGRATSVKSSPSRKSSSNATPCRLLPPKCPFQPLCLPAGDMKITQ